jgi:peptidoglycan/xylan/chitin deacetylase (PgdA/CDA1 family)
LVKILVNFKSLSANGLTNPMNSAALLRTCFDSLYFSGAAHAARALNKAKGVVFCLHHVCPQDGSHKGFAPNARLEVTPEFLAGTIALARRRGFETVSLAEAVRRLETPQSDDKPFAVFTLDDGYKDNQTFAQPVFDGLNCPFTVFVAPGIVEGSCELWWRGLEAVIKKAPHFKAKIGDRQFDQPTETIAQKNTAFTSAASSMKAMPEYDQRQSMRQIASDYGVDLVAMCKAVAMTWDEIRTLNKDPLCTIGAHTLGHYALAKLNEADVRREMEQSRHIISKELGEPVPFFAYPYGDEEAAGPRDFRIAQEAGFKSSVTTRKGLIYAKHRNHLQALPRIMVSGRFQKLRYMDVLISGLPMAIVNGFRRVNVS